MWDIISKGKQAALHISTVDNDEEREELRSQIIAAKAAMDSAIIENKNLVYTQLSRMRIAPSEELLQEGMIGLMHAVRTYDPDKGSFSTHAIIHIKKYLIQYLDNQSPTKLPRPVQLKIRLLRAIRRDFSQIVGRQPTIEEQAALALLPENDVYEAVHAHHSVSLDMPIKEEQPLSAYLSADLNSIDNGIDLDILLDVLDDREYTVIHNRYLREDGIRIAAARIGEALGLTSQRVGQIERTALAKMRRLVEEVLHGGNNE